MLNRNGDQLTYNPLNKVSLIQGANGKEVRFYYGVGGKRYRKQTADINTFYLGKSYEEQIKGSEEKQICYISLGGKTIGTHTQVLNIDYVPSNANYKETPFNNYFHTDALGSITAITDDSATVIERRSYEAFGKIRAMDYGLNNLNAIIPTNTVLHSTRGYTGHEQIAEISGLIHMNARLYDSDIGRFLSADTIIQAPKDSQAYNRYTYVRNNPMMFTDPSGHSWFSKIVKKVKNWVKKNVYKIIGIVVVGVAILLPSMWTPTLLATGESLINYNHSQPESKTNQITISIGGTIPIGNSPSAEQEQVDSLEEQDAEIEKNNAGLQNPLGASSDNVKFAGGDITINNEGKYEYTPFSTDMQNKNRDDLQRTINEMVSDTSNLHPNLKKALNTNIIYIDDPRLNLYNDPENFYGGAKRSNNDINITPLAYRSTASGENYIGIYGHGVNLSRQDRLEITLIHEAHHFSYSGLLGPRGPGRHENEYYNHVGKDWMMYKRGQK